jgi:hypothetical protein
LIGNGIVNTLFGRHWFSSRHVKEATDTRAAIEDLLKSVFSLGSVSRLYNERQLQLRVSLETAVRRVGGWCEMAASLREREPGCRVTSAVGRQYRAAQ